MKWSHCHSCKNEKASSNCFCGRGMGWLPELKSPCSLSGRQCPGVASGSFNTPPPAPALGQHSHPSFKGRKGCSSLHMILQKSQLGRVLGSSSAIVWVGTLLGLGINVSSREGQRVGKGSFLSRN